MLIIGRQEQIALAKERLLSLVPVEEIMQIPRDFHRGLIGPGAQKLRHMQSTHGVHIVFPKFTSPRENEGSGDAVTVTGCRLNVQQALDALKQELVVLEKQKQDYLARQFATSFHVDPKFYNKLIGQRGANIMKLRQMHDVNISLPSRNLGPNADVTSAGMITLVGYEDRCKACQADIEQQVCMWLTPK